MVFISLSFSYLFYHSTFSFSLSLSHTYTYADWGLVYVEVGGGWFRQTASIWHRATLTHADGYTSDRWIRHCACKHTHTQTRARTHTSTHVAIRAPSDLIKLIQCTLTGIPRALSRLLSTGSIGIASIPHGLSTKKRGKTRFFFSFFSSMADLQCPGV